MNKRWCSLIIIKLASQNIHDFTKVLSRNIYFGTKIQEITEIQEITKVFAMKVWSYTVVALQITSIVDSLILPSPTKAFIIVTFPAQISALELLHFSPCFPVKYNCK